MSKAPAPKPALAILGDRDLELGPFDAGETDTGPWQHWRLRTDEDNIAWLLFDKKDASANTLDEATLIELNAVLDKIEQERPRGLVIRSAKPSGFIAGADIAQFRAATDPAQIEAMLTKGHAVLDRLDNLPLSTVAVIHGFCLGGGLEVALACDKRIAIDDASFGFPEVLLGLHPGLGGTVRLPRLINPVQAMTMMLTGKTERTRRARSLGIVDAVTKERHVRGAVKAAVNGDLKTHSQGFLDKLLGSAPVRPILASRMRSEASKRAPEKFYPAPYALIDLWVHHGGSRTAMQREEIKSFAQLLVTDTSRNLVRVFFLREKLKGLAKGEFKGRRVHVIGAGAMGGDIAAWCAWHGFVVTLADMKPEPLAGAVKRAAELYGKINHGDRRKLRDALDRLIPDLAGHGASSADLIIEAVPEKLDLKQKVFASVEPRMKPGAILATNTSSIPLEQLREGLRRPERLIGIHFFNPVSRMQLVEVVSHDKVANDVITVARAFLGEIDRLPAPVKSEPGFLVNRALTPYMLEAMVMLNDGVKKETIDKAAEDFGMPMGPIELADEVGLDICLHVAEMLRGSLPDLPLPPKWLIDKVEKGELGKKTGKGFYEWKDGRAVKSGEAGAPPADMADRLILPMLNVCMECLRTGVVPGDEIDDGAMIFATGFAPFRGGPMHYARTRGIADVHQTLTRLAAKYGPRFEPDPGWDNWK
ncbi:MAG: 3-hydroxyacyl-CoA dehydrogenase / enoyl-CoA hydratase / 3-hydroxybutyryl-CoA epimerase [Pseudolabrys sp.]|jgi:3-hydroxyacyl-CoA dehydrogenase/enoyl-CoA hydratase/3-hydroxybutyryl-CoA epimerase|nr:3-hydroxyacyl-CoA dehydrogenase / enoyl-CoA hydratase / 3-hydroxybutyryl-CoA epimerase [Pseudolabrys sp.]